VRQLLAVAFLASLACGGGAEAGEDGMPMKDPANIRADKYVMERIDSRGDC